MDLANHEEEQYQGQISSQNNDTSPGGGGGGLLRFRSAPSSLFTSTLDSDERLISRFMDDDLQFPEFEDKPSIILGPNSASFPRPPAAACNNNNVTATMSHPNPPPHRSELPPQYPRNPIRSSGLARQSSSPAGFFSHFNNAMPNGFAPVGGMGNFRMATGTAGEVGTSPSGLNDQSSFPSRMQSTSLGLLSRISEVGDEVIDTNSPTSSQVKLGFNNIPFFRSAYPVDSWDDSAQFLENNGKMLPGSQTEQGSRPRTLSHHLSLPKSSTELATIEKLMQFPDSVPCKIRAKRGCATHPRSIAERVRRTRISERMRKLQDLVPNMDKQTNTSDMLDLAVDHIKDLQRQFKILSEKRANCKCTSRLLIHQQPY
ncbi:unnamed protein product [Rhodiola kirilowii]